MSSENWETPHHALEEALCGLSRQYTVWDPFFCHGRSQIYIEDLGFKVAPTIKHCGKGQIPCECLMRPPQYDVMVTNPPFTRLEAFTKWTLQQHKPAIVLYPTTVVSKDWFQEAVSGVNALYHVPEEEICFIRDGIEEPNVNFTSCWVYLFTESLDSEDMSSDEEQPNKKIKIK